MIWLEFKFSIISIVRRILRELHLNATILDCKHVLLPGLNDVGIGLIDIDVMSEGSSHS